MKYRKAFQETLDELMGYIEKQAKKTDVSLLQDLAKRYFSSIEPERLISKTIEELFFLLDAQYALIKERKPSEIKVNVFNPDLGTDAKLSRHTVIQVSQDNMPFLVDSIRICINQLGYLIRFMVYTGGMDVNRDKNGNLEEILPKDLQREHDTTEAPVCVEIDRQLDAKAIKHLQKALVAVLQDVAVVVKDWHAMQNRLQRTLILLEQNPPKLSNQEIEESKLFIQWLLKDNFIFLGACDFEIISGDSQNALKQKSQSRLGLMRQKHYGLMADLAENFMELVLSPRILTFAKLDTLSKVHRSEYLDCVSVTLFDEEGHSRMESRFLGLYTTNAQDTNPRYIPFLRLKIEQVLRDSSLHSQSYAGKELKSILETLPRQDLFQAAPKELLDLGMDILHLAENQRVRFFARLDNFGSFYSCLLYVPRDRFNTGLRLKIQAILMQELHGKSTSFTLHFTNSALVFIHFTVMVGVQETSQIDLDKIEQLIVQATQNWNDLLKKALLEVYGEKDALYYYQRYCNVFSSAYQTDYTAHIAVHDIEHIESLTDIESLSLSFFHAKEDNESTLHLKLFRRHHHITLSEVMPMLENMGVSVVDERQYQLKLKDDVTVWINDFELIYKEGSTLLIDDVRNVFREAFKAVWYGFAENDAFNQLILRGGLTWCEVAMLRAYAKYCRQIQFKFSQSYMEEALSKNSSIARLLVELFRARFNPFIPRSIPTVEKIKQEIQESLEQVSSLDQDLILRQYVTLIETTLRTNYYQDHDNQESKSYFAFKLNSSLIPDLPKPYPVAEIFVYSPRFEGVHLRCGKVARGGIRWSDRREDFRTEVLGLMKAQQVKNAVIVPMGAKGGFVVKYLLPESSRDEILEEGVYCYKQFIQALLDITDNVSGGKIVFPENVVCYDESDPYLVVAADKGTASFSDIANEISLKHGFWLGDAFASGGSAGYDHKKMGITAKGAWESVKRHFREMGMDTQSQDFTVVGIGDMSGDVFGNGMLLSKHIKLVGAFNHLHIFIDPSPDAKVSFEERRRLFNLPRCVWADYDASKISQGGGVFSRKAKSVTLSKEMKQLFSVSKDKMTPDELIKTLLTLDVDLLWSAGIGTFVKATDETNFEVSDRANDALRVDGASLRCKVVGEGGNLGFTQKARIQYDLHGGRICTDFIDNSAGVDCSDHEVNIKILLNHLVAKRKLSLPDRNALLAKMTKEVSALVLRDNYRQTQAISLSYYHAAQNLDLYIRVLCDVTQRCKIDSELENLPSLQVLLDRKQVGKGITRPELSMLMAHIKIYLKQMVLDSGMLDKGYFKTYLYREFPSNLYDDYKHVIDRHYLKNEIIATQLSNTVIDQMGITFLTRLQEETGASMLAIIKAFIITKNIFNKDALWEAIELLDLKVEANVQFEMMKLITQLIRRGVRWFLCNHDHDLSVQKTIEHFKPLIDELSGSLLDYLSQESQAMMLNKAEGFVKKGVPEKIAHAVAFCHVLLPSLDLVDTVMVTKKSLAQVASAYFYLGDLFDFAWLRNELTKLSVTGAWDALALVGFRDDLDRLQHVFTIKALKFSSKERNISKHVLDWFNSKRAIVNRFELIKSNMRSSSLVDPVMISVGLRELFEIARRL